MHSPERPCNRREARNYLVERRIGTKFAEWNALRHDVPRELSLLRIGDFRIEYPHYARLVGELFESLDLRYEALVTLSLRLPSRANLEDRDVLTSAGQINNGVGTSVELAFIWNPVFRVEHPALLHSRVFLRFRTETRGKRDVR
jgi:hypothetical protein